MSFAAYGGVSPTAATTTTTTYWIATWENDDNTTTLVSWAASVASDAELKRRASRASLSAAVARGLEWRAPPPQVRARNGFADAPRRPCYRAPRNR